MGPAEPVPVAPRIVTSHCPCVCRDDDVYRVALEIEKCELEQQRLYLCARATTFEDMAGVGKA